VVADNLKVSTTDVIASWLNPVPMVIPRTGRFLEVGDVTLAVTVFILTKAVHPGFFGSVYPALFSSLLLSWFFFRLYYDLRYFKHERMILVPPNTSDDVLRHELFHVHLGHIDRMSPARRFLAITPLGPFEFFVRAVRHDYGSNGVERELHARFNRGTRVFASPGLFSFAACAFVLMAVIMSLLGYPA